MLPCEVIVRASDPSAEATTIWKMPPARVVHASRSPFGDHAGEVL